MNIHNILLWLNIYRLRRWSMTFWTRICAAEMAVRYVALCACRKVHTWPISENRKFFYFGCSLVRRCKCKQSTSANGTDGQTDRRTDRVRRNMRPPPREEGRIITLSSTAAHASIRRCIKSFTSCSFVLMDSLNYDADFVVSCLHWGQGWSAATNLAV